MANHFSALKRARQTERRTARNRSNTSRLRSALRDMRSALTKGDKAAAEQAFRQTVSALDKGTRPCNEGKSDAQSHAASIVVVPYVCGCDGTSGTHILGEHRGQRRQEWRQHVGNCHGQLLRDLDHYVGHSLRASAARQGLV